MSKRKRMKNAQASLLVLLMLTTALAGCTDATVYLSDEDNDGIADGLDVCPDTPEGVQVDSNGCAIPTACPDFKVWDGMRQEFDNFGEDVQTDGKSVIVGAPQANGGMGKAFVFWCKTTTDGWLLEDELVVTSIVQDADNDFGHSVSILGDYAIVGDPAHDVVSDGQIIADAGAAFVFKRGNNGVWSEVAMLLEPDPNDGAHFGWSVDISASVLDRTGEYDTPAPGSQMNAVVGAPTSNAVNGFMTGAAYFFSADAQGTEFADHVRLDSASGYTSGGGQYQQDMWEDYGGYGHDVALFENTAVVGSPIESSFAIIQGTAVDEHGAAYVFVDISSPPSIENIPDTFRLTMPDDEYCIGLYGEGVWNENAFTYSLCDNDNYFGHSVDIDNDVIVVGAPGGPQTWSCVLTLLDSNGAAYVFEADKPGLWDELDYVKLEPSVSTEQEYDPQWLEISNYFSNDPHTYNTHLFGWEVSANRDMILVASKVRGDGWTESYWYGDNDVGPSAGSSYLFHRNGYLSWNEVAIIALPDIIYPPSPPNYNGYWWNLQGHTHAQVAIGGNYILVGSQHDDIRPIDWVPWGAEGTVFEFVPPGFDPESPTLVEEIYHTGKNTGSAYICWFDSEENVYCDWTEETNPGGASFTWGIYSISESNKSRDDIKLPINQPECPYQDENLCRINGYLYSEKIARLYHNATPYEFSCDAFENLNGTNYSFNYSYFMECFDTTDATGETNSSDDGGEDKTGGNGTDEQNETIRGCTDKNANNFNELAEVDDGTCTYDEEETERQENKDDA